MAPERPGRAGLACAPRINQRRPGGSDEVLIDFGPTDGAAAAPTGRRLNGRKWAAKCHLGPRVIGFAQLVRAGRGRTRAREKLPARPSKSGLAAQNCSGPLLLCVGAAMIYNAQLAPYKPSPKPPRFAQKSVNMRLIIDGQRSRPAAGGRQLMIIDHPQAAICRPAGGQNTRAPLPSGWHLRAREL